MWLFRIIGIVLFGLGVSILKHLEGDIDYREGLLGSIAALIFCFIGMVMLIFSF